MNPSTPYDKRGVLEMIINDLEIGPIAKTEGYYPIFLKTSRGRLEGRYYASAERRRGVIFVGDGTEDWNAPVRNILYPRLCDDLSRHSVNSLRIKYRHPSNLIESTLDVLAGIAFLLQEGVESIGLVGNAFGAGVVIQAAAASPFVSTVVSLSPHAGSAATAKAFRDTQTLLSIASIPGTSDKKYQIPETFLAIKDWLYTKV